MALSHALLETITEWCGNTPTLAEPRAAARRLFFGEHDPRPVKYWGGADEFVGRERRFLGWFAFSRRLPDGERPSVVAARRLFRGRELEQAVAALENVRFVTANVDRLRVGDGFELELETERFPVRFKQVSYRLKRDDPLVCHLVPARMGYWLLTPGWVVMPFTYGPGMREHLRDFQMDPIQLERFLQGRVDRPADEQERPPAPRDTSLSRAVARMTREARRAGRPDLVLSTREWTALIQPLIPGGDTETLGREIVARGRPEGIEDANKWLQLAMNIWNNTPQPDRGGKSAEQLAQESGGMGPLRVSSHELEIR